MLTPPTQETKHCACGSDAVEPELLKPGQPGYGTHYARYVCCDCGKFNGWQRNPALTRVVEDRSKSIAAILSSGRATDWERKFLASVSAQRHLTNKQQSCWQSIAQKHGQRA